MTIKEFLKLVYNLSVRKLCPPVWILLKRELDNCSSVLDLGCGLNSPLGILKNKYGMNFYSVGVDIFESYLLESEKKSIHSKYLKGNILNIGFPPNSFDCVVLLDVIEHLEKKDALALLPKLEKIAKKIVIFTPNGFRGQEDPLGDGNPYQTHRSGWTVDEMKQLGFRCYGSSGLKLLRKEQTKFRFRPKLVWQIISDLTQLIVLKKPKLAYHLFCVKERDDKR